MKNLRTRGRSIPEISSLCGVSKSTVSRYVKNVKILPRYYQRWHERKNASRIISDRKLADASARASYLIQDLSNRDLIITASLLYWAEGAKRDLSFSNTNPEMIRIFVYIVNNILGVKKEDLRVSLRLYEDLDEKTCLRFWSKITGINLNKKTSINLLYGKKKGKLEYGMCRIRVKKGGDLLKYFFAIVKRICDFTSPRSLTDKTEAS